MWYCIPYWVAFVIHVQMSSPPVTVMASGIESNDIIMFN